MAVKQLDHLNLSVGDFEATVAWYKRVFSFELVEEGNETDWGAPDGVRFGVLRAADAMLCIYEHPKLELPNPVTIRLEHGLHSLAHFGLRITDRPDWEATIEREQLEVFYDGPVQWPHSTAWYIVDPTGYFIEVALWDGDTVAFG